MACFFSCNSARCINAYILSIAATLALSTACAFQPYLTPGFILEDFEDASIDKRLFVFSEFGGTHEILGIAGNKYLALSVDGSLLSSDRVYFGFDGMNQTLPITYTVSYRIYIESLGATSVIKHPFLMRIIKEPLYLRFYREGSFYMADVCSDGESVVYSEGSGWEPQVITPGEWLEIRISVGPSEYGDLYPSMDAPRKWVVSIDDFEFKWGSIVDCPVTEATCIVASSGSARFRLDDFAVEWE